MDLTSRDSEKRKKLVNFVTVRFRISEKRKRRKKKCVVIIIDVAVTRLMLH